MKKNPGIIALFLLSSILLFTSCGTSTYSLMYNNIDSIILYRMNSYFDITASQKEYLNKHIKKLHTQHRKKHLQTYWQTLQTLKTYVKHDVSRKQIITLMKNHNRSEALFYKKIVTSTVPFLTQLNEKQVRHFSKKMEENRYKRLKKLAETDKRRIKTTIKSLEFFYGDLSDEQKKKIKKKVRGMVKYNKKDIMISARNNMRFIELLGKPHKEKELTALLLSWVNNNNTKKRVPDKHQRKNRLFMKQSIDLVLFVHNELVSPLQKKHAYEQITEIMEQIKNIQKS